MTAVHIHAPRPNLRKSMRNHCPTCERRTWKLAWFYEWYGWNVTCLLCGERWQDGERSDRPFKPRWRRESIDLAKKYWRRCKIDRVPEEKP